MLCFAQMVRSILVAVVATLWFAGCGSRPEGWSVVANNTELVVHHSFDEAPLSFVPTRDGSLVVVVVDDTQSSMRKLRADGEAWRLAVDGRWEAHVDESPQHLWLVGTHSREIAIGDRRFAPSTDETSVAAQIDSKDGSVLGVTTLVHAGEVEAQRIVAHASGSVTVLSSIADLGLEVSMISPSLELRWSRMIAGASTVVTAFGAVSGEICLLARIDPHAKALTVGDIDVPSKGATRLVACVDATGTPTRIETTNQVFVFAAKSHADLVIGRSKEAQRTVVEGLDSEITVVSACAEPRIYLPPGEGSPPRCPVANPWPLALFEDSRMVHLVLRTDGPIEILGVRAESPMESITFVSLDTTRRSIKVSWLRCSIEGIEVRAQHAAALCRHGTGTELRLIRFVDG